MAIPLLVMVKFLKSPATWAVLAALAIPAVYQFGVYQGKLTERKAALAQQLMSERSLVIESLKLAEKEAVVIDDLMEDKEERLNHVQRILKENGAVIDSCEWPDGLLTPAD